MANTQELLVVLDATTERLRRELTRAQRATADSTDRMDRSLQNIDSSFDRLNASAAAAARGVVASLGAMGVAFGATELVQGVGAVLDRMLEIQRVSAGLGISTESVQKLSYAFEQFGVDAEDVTEGLAQLSGQALGAITGSSGLIATWGQLGITVDQLKGKKPDELFRLLAKGIAQTEDPVVRLTAASSLLGEDLAAKLLPLLVQGTEGLDKMGDKVERLGGVFGEKLTKESANAARAIKDIKTQLHNTFTRAVAENAGVLADASRTLADTLADPKVTEGIQVVTNLSVLFVKNMAEGFTTLAKAITDIKNLDVGSLLADVGKGLINNSGPGVAFSASHGGTNLTDWATNVLTGKGNGPKAKLAELQKSRQELIDAYPKLLAKNSDDEDYIVALTEQYNVRLASLDKAIKDAKQTLPTVTVPGTKLPPKTGNSTAAGAAAHPSNALIGFNPASYGSLFEVSLDYKRLLRERQLAQLDKLRLDDFGKGPSVDIGSMGVSLPKVTTSLDDLLEKSKEVEGQFKKTGDAGSGLADIGVQMTASFSDGFADAVLGADNFGDALKSLAEDVATLTLKLVLMQGIKTGVNAMFGTTPSANGNVFDRPGLVPFAKGGIVTRPTIFPFANGTGLMGEAGPEAIMPLARGPGGKLGVRGGSGGVVVNISNHSQAKATAQSRRGPDGQQVIDVMVEDSFNRLLGSGRLDKSLAANVGVRRPGRF